MCSCSELAWVEVTIPGSSPSSSSSFTEGQVSEANDNTDFLSSSIRQLLLQIATGSLKICQEFMEFNEFQIFFRMLHLLQFILDDSDFFFFFFTRETDFFNCYSSFSSYWIIVNSLPARLGISCHPVTKPEFQNSMNSRFLWNTSTSVLIESFLIYYHRNT